MNTMNIVIVEDKQSDFFRLQEQIRSRALTISKIYSCRFHSEFLELLKENGVEVIDLNSAVCIELLSSYISANPDIWNEDIGE